MKKFSNFWLWLRAHPTALINLLGIVIIIFGIFGYVVFQTTRDINVLEDWEISLSNPKETRKINDKEVAVYNPGGSLVFNSQSKKVANAEGVSVRTIVCDATATQKAREIQLDQIPATRPIGVTPKRENAVVVPDVSQFAGLPRWCRLVIDVTYRDVNGTGRTWQEHAETDKFLVEEAKLDPNELLLKIDTLEKQITDLRSQLPVSGSDVQQSAPATPSSAAPAGGDASSSSTTGTTGGTSTTNNTTNNTTVQEVKTRRVCDPLINLFILRLGETNCREERI